MWKGHRGICQRLDDALHELREREHNLQKFQSMKENLDTSILHEIASMLDISENKSWGEYAEEMENTIAGFTREQYYIISVSPFVNK